MALTETRAATAGRWPALEFLAAGGIAVLLLRPVLVRAFAGPAAQTWATVFVSLTIQALPFLVLGVLVSGAIAAFVPAGSLARVLPRRAVLAVPAASLAGVLVPGCECSSVPVAGRLLARGAPALGQQDRGGGVRLDPPLPHTELEGLVEVVPVVVDRACGEDPGGHAAEQLLEPFGGGAVDLELSDDRNHAGPEELMGIGDGVWRLHPGVARLGSRGDVRAAGLEPCLYHLGERLQPLPPGHGVAGLRPQRQQLIEVALDGSLVDSLDLAAGPVRNRTQAIHRPARSFHGTVGFDAITDPRT